MGGVQGASLKYSLFKMQSPSFIMKIYTHTISDFSSNFDSL